MVSKNTRCYAVHTDLIVVLADKGVHLELHLCVELERFLIERMQHSRQQHLVLLVGPKVQHLQVLQSVLRAHVVDVLNGESVVFCAKVAILSVDVEFVVSRSMKV